MRREQDRMMSQAEAKRLVRTIFREHALVLGGLAALDEIDDEAVWRLVRSLGALRHRTLRRIDHLGTSSGLQRERTGQRARPHPAIAEFLRQIRGEAA